MKTIKVKETKTHTVLTSYGPNTRGSKVEQVPVAEAKLVLVECKPEEEALIAINTRSQEIIATSLVIKGILWKYYKPILISETEVKKEGDQVLSDNHEIFTIDLIRDNSLRKIFFKEGTYCTDKEFDTFYKVLALPEHFSPKLLQDIVDGKLKEGDRVLVECEDNMYLHKGSGKYWEDEPVMMKKYLDRPEKYVKLNSSGHITLHKLEEKKYELNFIRHITGFSIPEINEKYDKWFNANVK